MFTVSVTLAKMWFSVCFATWYHLFSRLTSQFLQLISICANLNHPHCHVYRLAILIMLNDFKWRKQTKSEKHVYTFFILSVALYLWCICWRSISLINKLIWTYFPWAFVFIYLYHHHASSFHSCVIDSLQIIPSPNITVSEKLK